jgi:hypothetical protein
MTVVMREVDYVRCQFLEERFAYVYVTCAHSNFCTYHEMTSETSKLKSTLSTLDNSLDDLEAQLESLLAQALPETVARLDTIQQAKLQTVLPYLVYDLIFSLYITVLFRDGHLYVM